MNSFDEVFEHVKRYCLEKGQIPEVAVKLWIDALHPVDLSGTDAVFTIQSDFQRSVILSNYEPLLKEAFRNILGFDVNLVIRIEEEFEPEPTQTESTGSEDLALRNQQLEKSFEGANYEYTFSTFIVGRSNEFAYAACTAVAKEPGKSYNPLFIYGPSGLGKTHLMHAIAHEVEQQHPDYNIIYVTSEEFGNDLINGINRNNMASFHDKYRSADVLLIDDIQFFSDKDRMQEEFFHTFNKLHAENKQIVITSDKPPRELKTLEERIRTRFECGLITDITIPDFETRIAIIRRKAELLDLHIPDDVAEFIANRLKTNIRQLEGAVKKLKAEALRWFSAVHLHGTECHQGHPEQRPACADHCRKNYCRGGRCLRRNPGGNPQQQTLRTDFHRSKSGNLCCPGNHADAAAVHRNGVRRQRSFDHCLCHQ